MEACYYFIIERSDDGDFHLIQIKAAWPARRDAWVPQNITDHTMPRSRAIVWMDSTKPASSGSAPTRSTRPGSAPTTPASR